MEGLLFYMLSALILFGAVRVVSTRNLVHSVIAAFVVLSSTAALFFLLNAEFLGVVQILVYAGAVTILVLFVVMLTSAGPNFEVSHDGPVSPLMVAFAIVLFALLGFVIWTIKWRDGVVLIKGVTEKLAMMLFTEYLLPFEVASILLLAALVGAVVLARKD